MSDRQQRLARNAESKAAAEHDREPWSSDEVEFLLNFFPEARGDANAEREVTECLGRTIEACRQRFYESRRGRAKIVHKKTTTTTTIETSTYIGKFDDPDDQWWSADYYK